MRHLSSRPQSSWSTFATGAPNWGLPPAKTPMIWQGLTDAQICQSIKDHNKTRTGTLINSSST